MSVTDFASATAVAAFSLLIALAGCRSEPAGSAQPHIVLITSDTLRADHLSLAGYRRKTSPRIDRLAASAHVFTDAITVIPKTGPSFTTMFSGKHPQEHRVRSNTVAIPAELPLLAERLAAAGYETAAFVGNPVLHEERGYGRGFATYRVSGGPRSMAKVTQGFLRWAKAPWSKPTFVWIHYIDPHGPYLPPPALEREFLSDPWTLADKRVVDIFPIGRHKAANKVLGAIPAYQRRDDENRVGVFVARYDAEIRAMDGHVARVLRALHDKDVYDRAAIIFTSDHGESLGEHDFYFEHGWFAYEPTLHIPLLIKAVGQTEGRRIDTQVSNLDLLPTVLELASLPPDPGAVGVDLLSAPIESRTVLIENSDSYPEKYVGVRTGRWKYLRRVSDGAEELYDLKVDRAETDNLAARELAVLKRLRTAYNEAVADIRAFEPTDPGEVSEELREQLRALGYLD